MSYTSRSLERLRGTKRPAPIHPHARRALQGADRDLCLAAYIVTTLLFCGLTVAPFVMGGFIFDAMSHAILWLVSSTMMLFFMFMLCVGCD
jgi:hypothetical protein